MNVAMTIAVSYQYQTLEEVAKCIFDTLGIQTWEERHSLNYPPDEHYFAGYAANVELKVYDADSDIHDYPFHLSVATASWCKGAQTIDGDPRHIAQALARSGLVVLMPTGAWYRSDSSGEGE
jgi:hypothetical protein